MGISAGVQLMFASKRRLKLLRVVKAIMKLHKSYKMVQKIRKLHIAEIYSTVKVSDPPALTVRRAGTRNDDSSNAAQNKINVLVSSFITT